VSLGKFNVYNVPTSFYVHTALGFCTGSLQFPTTDDLDLSLKSYVTPPNLKKRRYTFQRMSHRTHLTLNSLQMFMINDRRYTRHRSLMITATLIPTAVPLVHVNRSHPQFRKSTRAQIVIRNLPGPLRKSLSVTTIISVVTIPIGSDHHLFPIGVQFAVHP
jgi:hypothetical protein